MPAVSTLTVRVYYEDTDAGGIVYYANYLKFFERARTEWLRGIGVGQQALKQDHNAIFVVKCAAVDYHAPAKLDDAITLTLAIEKLGKVSVEFIQYAHRDDTLLATARVKVGCIDFLTQRPLSMPPAVAELMRSSGSHS